MHDYRSAKTHRTRRSNRPRMHSRPKKTTTSEALTIATPLFITLILSPRSRFPASPITWFLDPSTTHPERDMEREMEMERERDLAMEDLRCSSGFAADHLVVMVHGILGSSCDWTFAANQFLKAFPDKVTVHCSECNVYTLTLDGIDVMGDRLANEVIEVINRKPEVRKISFVAHSMGGLVARYAIGKLYTPSGKLGKSTICSAHNISVGTIHGLEAVNFITIATPHLGSRGNRQVPMFLGIPALEKVASYVAPWIFRRTGKHLFLTDCDEGDLPLLQRMVTDDGGIYFMSALKAFKRRVAYANACYDHIVGWRTSSLRRHSELPKLEVSLCTRYPHIVHEEYAKEENTGNAEVTGCSDKIEEELVMGLRKVSWEKVDVSFHRSILRFAAHSVIQVKRDFLCSEGADVIQHLIDRFIV